jgi:pimeloyl-ACP methyl ester carboxylesterase
MASNHTVPIEIKHGVNTQGFFSYEDPSLLIVFVHGFGGDAISTWNHFPSLIVFEDRCRKADIIFYGYDTFKGQAGDHAAELYHFLVAAQKPLTNNILPGGQRLPERSYLRILLVAHSLGAVLVRQAQLLAHIAKDPWVKISELALFAPAHHGAKIISLATEALPGLSGLLGVFAKFRFPILNDLDSGEDGILKDIKEQTKGFQDKGEADFSKAKLVVYAKNDKVVRAFQFLQDSPPKVMKDTTHIRVCKPMNSQHDAIKYLRSII